MSDISWTDKAWPIVTGCSPASLRCLNCWSARGAATRLAHLPQYAGTTRDVDGKATFNGDVRTHENKIEDPLHWKKPQKIFPCAGADLFHEAVPFEFIDKVFAVMALTPQHDYQILTKRISRCRDYLTMSGTAEHKGAIVDVNATQIRIEHYANIIALRRNEVLPWRPKTTPGYMYGVHRDMPWPLPNVWIGTSIEDQRRYDERYPVLMQCPAAVRWVSFEPLIGPVRVEPDGRLDWAVIGGESGYGEHVRECWVEWIQYLERAYRPTDTRVYVKQLGSRIRQEICGLRRPVHGLDHKGERWDLWPDSWHQLKVRQFPKAYDAKIALTLTPPSAVGRTSS